LPIPLGIEDFRKFCSERYWFESLVVKTFSGTTANTQNSHKKIDRNQQKFYLKFLLF
jgi:hypothetical protein